MAKVTTTPEPPKAPRRPKVLEKHGDRRVDPYYWMREKGNPEVIAHLKAENAYTDAITAPTEELREQLYREIVGRIQETDTSAPSFFKGYWNYTRTVEGLDYEIYCRRPGSTDATEQVLLDGNELATGHHYFDLGFVEASPDQNVRGRLHGRRAFRASLPRSVDGRRAGGRAVRGVLRRRLGERQQDVPLQQG
jgi:oligopeptidase B